MTHYLKGRKCVALGCDTHFIRARPHIKLFTFPQGKYCRERVRHTGKEFEFLKTDCIRYNKWKEVAKIEIRDDEMPRFYLCALHFPQNQFIDKQRDFLIRGAVPTVLVGTEEYHLNKEYFDSALHLPCKPNKENSIRIRDDRKDLKLQQTKSGQGAFVIKEENRTSGIPSSSVKEEEDADYTEVENLMEEFPELPTSSTSSTSNNMRKANKRQASDTTESISSSSDHDSLTNFFMNMVETVKTFPLSEQVTVKRRVFEIVNDIEAALTVEREEKNC